MRTRLFPALAILFGLLTSQADAHFQTLIPSRDLLDQDTTRSITLDLSFTHPMKRGPTMEMAMPVRFGVLYPGGQADLLTSLAPYQHDGATAYQSHYRFTRPGDHIFFVQPSPYWEAEEQKMIIHYTKVVVDAFSGERNWTRSVGFPVEIEPLSRPYGLWTGNLFRGVIKHRGEPVPFAEIEVEWLNDGSITPPADAYITQVVRADANGTFSYAIPHAGWWGFAALIEAESPMKNPRGEPVAVEQGAVIWVFSRDMR